MLGVFRFEDQAPQVGILRIDSKGVWRRCWEGGPLLVIVGRFLATKHAQWHVVSVYKLSVPCATACQAVVVKQQRVALVSWAGPFEMKPAFSCDPLTSSTSFCCHRCRHRCCRCCCRCCLCCCCCRCCVMQWCQVPYHCHICQWGRHCHCCCH